MSVITFVLLDSTETTYGVSVKVDGVDTTQFEKNPVMFYQHNDWNMPVGRWENVRKENGQLLADAVFDYDDDDKDVKRMIRKVEKGFIKMASCGLVDLEGIRDPINPDGTKILIEKCRLREASIVSIGGNHNAMRLYDREGKEIDLKSETLNLADFIVKPKIENPMSKKYLQMLNLADDAGEEMIEAAVLRLTDDKKKADEQVITLTDAQKKLQEKLDAIELADKEARRVEAIKLVDEAIKSGRLTEKEDGSVKQAWLTLFDGNHESAKSLLSGLPERQARSFEMADKPGESEWDKRQREIDEKNKEKNKSKK